MIKNANNFILMVSGDATEAVNAFAHSTECSISFTNNLMEVTTNNATEWKNVISGKKLSEISFSGLVDYGTITNKHNVDDLIDFLLDADELDFQIGDGIAHEYGKGFISSIEKSGGTDSAPSYSGTLQVTGSLSEQLMTEDVYLLDSDGNRIQDDFGRDLTAKIR